MELEKIRDIYMKMGDDISRQIFVDRFLYSITGNAAYLQNVIQTSQKGNMFLSRLKEAAGSGAVIFGTGFWGKEIYQALPDFAWRAWVDAKPRNEKLYQIPVIAFEPYIRSYGGECIVVSSRLYHKQIVEQLLTAGIPAEKIINAGQILDAFIKEQYFDPVVLTHPYEKEIFVDAGSFDGSSSVSFKHWSKGNIFVYAFEPDLKNAEKCKDTFLKNKIPAKVISKGLWSKRTQLRFEMKATALSKVCIGSGGGNSRCDSAG